MPTLLSARMKRLRDRTTLASNNARSLKPSRFHRLAATLFALGLAGSTRVFAADSPIPLPPPESWHAKSLGAALMNMSVFGLVGVIVAIIGYKIFDLVTPGDMHKEIVENRNVAAGIVGAAVIIGVCIVVAAAMS